MTTLYGLTQYTPRADNRRMHAVFDGVLIDYLPRMLLMNDGEVRPDWRRITPGAHGDDSAVRMETIGKKYNGRDGEGVYRAYPWQGHIVLYATARWQVGDVVRVEVWESEWDGEVRPWWRLVWTAAPASYVLLWHEEPIDSPNWEFFFKRAHRLAVIEGGPEDARQMGVLGVYDAPAATSSSSQDQGAFCPEEEFE